MLWRLMQAQPRSGQKSAKVADITFTYVLEEAFLVPEVGILSLPLCDLVVDGCESVGDDWAQEPRECLYV